jgi:hypothetical protein
VINKKGKLMFEAKILDEEGNLPKLFRSGLLRADSTSSLSRMMSEIERTGDSDFDDEAIIQKELDKLKSGGRVSKTKSIGGDTSVESLMDETPSNYNVANQRFTKMSAAHPMSKDAPYNKRKRELNPPEIDEEDLSDLEGGIIIGPDKSVSRLGDMRKSGGGRNDKSSMRSTMRRTKRNGGGGEKSDRSRDPTDSEIAMALAYGGAPRATASRKRNA